MTLHRASPARCGKGGEWPAGPGLPPGPVPRAAGPRPRAAVRPHAVAVAPANAGRPPGPSPTHGGRRASWPTGPRRKCRAVTSRPRGAGGDVAAAGDESRCRDAVPGHAGPPPRLPGAPAWRPPRGQRQRRQRQRGQRRVAAPLFRLLLTWGGPGPRRPPDLVAGGTTALGALLRCFPCERLCGGCTVPPAPPRPPGALPPAMPPARRRLPPAAHLPPRTFHSYLPRSQRTYSCVHCRAHLARHEELISKSFQGSHGRAYLFNSVVNVGCGPAEQRLLLTGLHSVADIFCQSCKTTLGWKYEQAFESSQKYKEGKFIIEMSHMVKENGWD
ncbi:protein yippee-like 4 [Falco cherrug]|uniref:protein yippee-like 4 n=1 Tax=Falco cherrug TaxID=345164 RepID=UPI002478B4A8|nr:protein yippee-like 4 [Falco cherrug]